MPPQRPHETVKLCVADENIDPARFESIVAEQHMEGELASQQRVVFGGESKKVLGQGRKTRMEASSRPRSDRTVCV